MSAATLDEQCVILTCPECGQKNRAPYSGLAQSGKCGRCHHPLFPPAFSLEMYSSEDCMRLLDVSTLPVLVDFWAPWCGPCRMLGPELEKAARQKSGELIIAKVNTENVPDLAQRFQIRSIPTMILFSGGQELTRTSGALPFASIVRFVESAVQ